MSPRNNHPRGVTLVELLVALSILAVMSTAVTVLLAGAGNTHQYVNQETDALAQVENAYRRMLHNVRCASALTGPSTVTTPTAASTPAFSITTQAGATGTTGTVRYYVSGGNLVESDSRLSPAANILLHNVRTFTVNVDAATATTPTCVTILIESNTQPVIKREARIACRNL